MNKVFLSLLILFFVSCDDSTEHTIKTELNVIDTEIIPIGVFDSEEIFKLDLTEDTAKCIITTTKVYENDSIYFLDATLKGNYIVINLTTTPAGVLIEDGNWIQLDPDEWVHEIKFKIIGLHNQFYRIRIIINGRAKENNIDMDLAQTNSFITNF